MIDYQVLARKYRPQIFGDVVGQQTIVTTLKNAIHHNRTAHAYLFCGSRGTGKTTLARLFAKALNCVQLTSDCEPCNRCCSCKEIGNGSAIDVLEIDGASHRGIEDIRQINETIGFVPSGGRYKIYLIDEVHMLTKEAFNALLKTLEEPPKHVKFFFATTEPHKLPPTILSRCQRFNLRRISLEPMQNKLQSIATDMGISINSEALLTLATLSEGSLRDAQSLLDQVIAFQEGAITTQTVNKIFGLPTSEMFFALDQAGHEGKMIAAFEIAEEIFSSGQNVAYFIKELIAHFRTLFLLKNKAAIQRAHRDRYQKSSLLYREDQLIHILEFVSEAEQTIRMAPSERTALEVLLLRILRTHQLISLESLVQRLITLEKKLPTIAPAKEVPQETQSHIPKCSSKAPDIQKDFSKEEKCKTGRAAKCSSGEQVEKSRLDTLMQFATKELNGRLTKVSLT